MSDIELAEQVMERVEVLGRVSEELGKLTRTFCSPAMRQVNKLVGSWMREAGMTVSEDAIGNIVGRYSGREEHAKTLLLGSHLDTVRDAGKFDGPLGVLIAIACVQHLHKSDSKLPFVLEVIGFSDEEGVRFQSTYLGSKVLAGKFNEHDLRRTDVQGITMAEAIKSFGGAPDKLGSGRRDPSKLLGYVEVHIEQGPVLEQKQQPVGVVSAIAGQTRVRAKLTGQAGHAGTVPMNLRRDALAAAAEFILATETMARGVPGLVATVGQIDAKPGAVNVIPGEVNLTIDVRHQSDASRTTAVARLQDLAGGIAEKRGIATDWEVVHEVQSVPCSRELSGSLAKAARRHLVEVTELASGAGHDAAMLGEITPIAMLFVRCKGGISHHPDESVSVEDVRVAIAVMNDFLLSLGNNNTQFLKKKNG
jgi:allantoate deiminase